MSETHELILQQLKEISSRLTLIEEKLEYIKKSNDNMNEHIDFVENVYNTVKSPFYYIMSKVKRIDVIPEKQKSIKEN
jgi:glycerol-3-phosphate responsive antiterminator